MATGWHNDCYTVTHVTLKRNSGNAMSRYTQQRTNLRRGLLIAGFAALFASGAALAAPKATVYSDVQITYGGQTFGFSGIQTAFTVNQDGGRVVFSVTTVDPPGYLPLPQIDTSSLPEAGNRWEIVTKVGTRSYSFAGTCATETFTTSGPNGGWVRHLFLNCKDFTSI